MVTDELATLIRGHKTELLGLLWRAGNNCKFAVDAAMEQRRQRVLAMLERRPEIERAYLVDGDSDPVRVALAVRAVGSCELQIARDRFDPIELLKLIQQHEVRTA